MRLHVKIAVPNPETVDVAALAKVFPYGQLNPIEVSEGGMLASSGIMLEEMGDKNDQMVIAIAAVYVGY